MADLAESARMGLDGGATMELVHQRHERIRDCDPLALVPAAAPVRIIHGDKDNRVPLHISQRYVEVATNARLEVISGADHFDLIDPDSAAMPAVENALFGL